jgi:L-malate glycosyltransferase
MKNTNIVDHSYWENYFKNIAFSKIEKDNLIRIWIEKYLPEGKGDAIEIGAFPGSFLTIFGNMGYCLHGIDRVLGIETTVPQFLKSLNYVTGAFIQNDFLAYDFKEIKYDVVSSFGFIEHFTDWKDVIRKHADITKSGGYLILETPNFKGIVQRLIHWFLDRENFNRHIIDSMDPNKWRTILGNDFEILYCGWFGRFKFWVDIGKRNFLQRIILRIAYFITPYLSKILPDHSAYSPWCGIIARKNIL